MGLFVKFCLRYISEHNNLIKSRYRKLLKDVILKLYIFPTKTILLHLESLLTIANNFTFFNRHFDVLADMSLLNITELKKEKNAILQFFPHTFIGKF